MPPPETRRDAATEWLADPPDGWDDGGSVGWVAALAVLLVVGCVVAALWPR